jgi:general secretion pathway protein H
LELLIVLVIIGLISAVVLPRVGGNLGALKLKSDARKVAAALRYARSQAVSENRTIRVLFKPKDGQMILTANSSTSDGDYPWHRSEAEKEMEVLYRLNLSEAGIIDGADLLNQSGSDDPSELIFYPGGGSSGGTVLLGSISQKRYKLIVSAISGAVRVEEDIASAVN